MSYFMTISGHLPKQSFPQLEFLPISQGQKYVADLEPELSASDGIPLWFVHDGETGTSHGLVSGAQDYHSEHGTLDGTLLLRLMEACVAADCGFRIWWGSAKPGCHRELAEFTGFEELCSGIVRLLSEGRDISVRRKRNGQQGGPSNAPASSGATGGPLSVSRALGGIRTRSWI